MRNATRCGLWWAEMLKTRDQCKEAATLYFRISGELGVFEMSQSGLQAVQNPGEIFLGEPQIDTEEFTGQVVAVMMDGSQSFIVVVQICRYFSDPQNYFQDNDHYARNKLKVVLFPILDKRVNTLDNCTGESKG
ncbi:uncharacterized protein LOC141712902 isoform X2 [Apium graveolens]|uniref:uncharacterized protein LOC141712902 isoform X2 n=1 Tax=Apium graveolens TaxID=4045 RepID=UPI003D7B3F75